MAAQKSNVSAHIQEGRWIINLTQALGVLRLVPGEQAASGSLRLRQFLGSGAQRLTGMDGLRYGCGEAVGLQRGERGVENGFGAAQLAEQFSGHAGAEAWRQSLEPTIPGIGREPSRLRPAYVGTTVCVK